MISSRHTASIVFTDIYRFTEKMEQNEELTMRQLHLHNRTVESLAARFDGRVVKSTGDGYLMEFPKAADAIVCVICVQAAFKRLNADLSREEKLLVRIGIHYGEVIQRGLDIFGTDVNIAARIQQLAVPGEIYTSHEFCNVIGNDVNLTLEDLGSIPLKHVVKPVGIYHILISDELLASEKRDAVIDELNLDDKLDPNAEQALAGTRAEELHDKIAVLVFKVLSPRPEDDHLGFGMTEAILFGLSRERDISVHPLESVTALGELASDPVQVANILGAGYIVQGVVQRGGTQLMVQVELIKAADGSRLYAESILGVDDDIFDIQNKVVKSILHCVLLRVTDEVKAALATSAPKNQLAATFYLKGSYLYRTAATWKERKQAISILENAVKSDPSFALAKVALARAYSDVYGQWQSDIAWLEKAHTQAQAAVDSDPKLPDAYEILGKTLILTGDMDTAEMMLSQAITLNPESISGRILLARVYSRRGDQAEAKLTMENAYDKSLELIDPIARMDVLQELALLSRSSGSFLKAIEYLTLALTLAQRSNSRVYEAGIRLNMGNTFLNMGNLTLAQKNLNESRDIFIKCESPKYMSGIYNSLGSIEEARHRLENAITEYKKGLKCCREVEDKFTEATILTNMGRVLGNLGRNHEALDVLRKAVDVRGEIGDAVAKIATTLVNLAAVYVDLGRHAEALDSYEKADGIFRNIGSNHHLMGVTLNIGEIYEFESNLEKAETYYNEAFEFLGLVDANKYSSFVHLFRGRLFYQQERFADAQHELENVVLDEAALPTVKLRARLYLSMCKEIIDDGQSRLPEMEEAIRELDEIGSHPELVEVLRIFGGYLLKSNHRKTGLKYLERGLSLAKQSCMQWELKRIENLLQS